MRVVAALALLALAGCGGEKPPAGDLGDPPLLDSLELDGDVPSEAVSTGDRRGRWTLWHVAGDDRRVWPVRDDGHAERWPRPAQAVGCA
jgi:hypothetical protein